MEANPPQCSTRDASQALEELHRRVQEVEGGPRKLHPRISSGCPPLDQILPEGGWRQGSLVEWLGAELGCGASTLALAAASAACREGGLLVVVDRAGLFYPPAAAGRIDVPQTVVVRPQSDEDENWTLTQALRCRDVAAVLAWPARLDSHAFRRLKLAAEASGCLGLLVRPGTVRKRPSWADLRLLVTPRTSPRGWRLHVRLLRYRGQVRQTEIEMNLDEQTGAIDEAHPGNLAPPVADPTAHEQSA